MDLGIIGGVVIGIVLIFVSIGMNGGGVTSFIDLASVLIVLGGTLASTFVNFTTDQIRNMSKVFRVAMSNSATAPDRAIRMMVHFADKARREGLLAMEEEALELDDPFLRKGMGLVVDGTDPETVRQILDIELTFLEERHKVGRQLFEYMGNVAPAFGMIGTLIGLIIMLGNLDQPEKIGPGMAVALITTFYGVLLANLVFTPIAGKLRLKSEAEILLREMMIEGILSIQAGENPRIVEQKLQSFLSPEIREREEPSSEVSQTAGEAATSGV